MRKIIVATALSVACSAALLAVPYEIDVSHSSVGFNVKHMSVSNVKGALINLAAHLMLKAKLSKH